MNINAIVITALIIILIFLFLKFPFWVGAFIFIFGVVTAVRYFIWYLQDENY
jgi:hypothetical protein